MKKVFFLVAALVLCSWVMSAQSGIADFEKSLPDSVKYYQPEFGTGRIVYKDGQFSVGKFNISTIDQTVRFIDSDGSIKGIRDNSSVDRVSISGVLFLKHQNSFMAVSQEIDGIFLCATRKMVFTDAKKGAFGMESETTSIKSSSRIEGNGGVIYDNGSVDNYVIKTIPLIYRKNIAYAPTKKLLLRFFKDRADKINDYLCDHNVNFNDFDQVYDLFEAIK